MAQTIVFKHGKVCDSLDAAKAKLDKITAINYGEPIAVKYYADSEKTDVRILFAIGINETNDQYRLIATVKDIEDITTTVAGLRSEISGFYTQLSQVSGALSDHEDTLAGDEVLGHVESSDDIKFTDGKGTINSHIITYDKLVEAAQAGIIGITSSELIDGKGTYRNLSWDEVKKALNLSYLSGIKVGDKTLTGPEITISGDSTNGVSVTAFTDDNSVHISLDTNTVALKSYVESRVNEALGGTSAMHYQGTITDLTTLPAASAGDLYYIATTGTITDGDTTYSVTSGDILICKVATAQGAYNSTNWDYIEVNDSGITGPTSSTGDNIVTWNGTTGNKVKDSGININEVAKNTLKVKSDTGISVVNVDSDGNEFTPEYGVNLANNVKISLADVETTNTRGGNNVVTNITTNSKGQVTAVSYDLAQNLVNELTIIDGGEF